MLEQYWIDKKGKDIAVGDMSKKDLQEALRMVIKKDDDMMLFIFDSYKKLIKK